MALRAATARRPTDRLEDFAAWALVAVGLLVALFSYGFGAHSYEQGLERVQAESADRTPASARLLADTDVTSSADSRSTIVMAPATWTDRFGSTHGDLVMVPRGRHAGDEVTIWTDASGARVTAPMTRLEALVCGLTAGGAALAGGIGLLAAVWALVRRATMAVNCARWADEWRHVAPNWTRGTPG